MKKARILLADTDQEYLSLFEIRLLEQYGETVELQMISDAGYFADHFSRPQELELLLVDEAMWSPELSRHPIREIVRLSEEPVQEAQGAEGPRTLYKYVPIKSIFAQISAHLTGSGEDGGPETQVVCIYSPAGGGGATTVAIGLAGALAWHSRRVLYLDTQLLQNSSGLLQPDSGLSPELRTALLSGGEEAAAQLQAACGGRGSFDYLPPVDHVATAYGIGAEHYRRLLEPLKRLNVYDYIVVDCSSDFTAERSRLISECDRVVVVTGQSAPSCWKASVLLRDISVGSGEKFLFFCNRYDKERPDHLKDMLPSWVTNVGYLPVLAEEVCLDPVRLASTLELDRLALRIL